MTASKDINPEDWVDLYGDNLFRYAVHRVKDATIAEELVQETFLAAMRTKDRFEGRASEKTWLFSILKHKMIDFYRSKSKEMITTEAEERFSNQDDFFNENGAWRIKPQVWSYDPEKAYEFKQFLDLFYQCLGQVPQRLADAFVYREIDGLTIRKICKILDITTTNCGVMLYRARLLLRRCLESNSY
jgi:RNA polymerase sigma-70 factor (TIGR02943 family)